MTDLNSLEITRIHLNSLGHHFELTGEMGKNYWRTKARGKAWGESEDGKNRYTNLQASNSRPSNKRSRTLATNQRTLQQQISSAKDSLCKQKKRNANAQKQKSQDCTVATREQRKMFLTIADITIRLFSVRNECETMHVRDGE